MKLIINSLCKKFDKKTVFNNFSHSFPEKGIVAIAGESGIGKTTLLRIIAGLDKDYCGEVLGGGIGNVSFAFQEYRLFPNLTAFENVIFAISDGKDEAVCINAKKLLMRLGFRENDFTLLPSELSGGMKQRVSLARAFMKKADILLLDEPTKELDPTNAKAVKEIITEQSKERLIIMVSHHGDDISDLNAEVINISKNE